MVIYGEIKYDSVFLSKRKILVFRRSNMSYSHDKILFYELNNTPPGLIYKRKLGQQKLMDLN